MKLLEIFLSSEISNSQLYYHSRTFLHFRTKKIFFVSFIKKFELNNWSLLTFPCNLLQNQIPILEKANCG